MAFNQTRAAPGDRASWVDISNAQVFIQKTDGLIQFFVQAGAYSLPDLGTPYVKASSLTRETYGIVPQTFVKMAPSDHFNLMIGKLPSIWGSETTFSFENSNIERGLLWNQTNSVNRGIQVNYTKGSLTVALSLNDGLYSNRYDWGSALIGLAVDSENMITVDVAGDYFGHSAVSSTATPPAQDNSQVYGLIFSHSAGPVMVMPYIQYSYVPAVPSANIRRDASTMGAGAIAKYSFTRRFALAARAEYIGSTGTAAQGAPNLLYGPGSRAWSLTLTPTYQFKTFFVRGEVSFVKIDNLTPGLAFGQLGQAATQTRAMVETGILY